VQEQEHRQRIEAAAAAKKREEDRIGRENSTRFDMNEARKRLDKLNAPKAVNGTGNIEVDVKPERTRTGSSNVLKKDPGDPPASRRESITGPSGPPRPRPAKITTRRLIARSSIHFRDRLTVRRALNVPQPLE
jgi:hypothetical protein